MMRRSSATAARRRAVAGVAIGAELRNRQALLLPRLAPLERCREAPLLVFVDLAPARRLHEAVERLGVRGDARGERLLETLVVVDLERLRVLLDGGKLLVEAIRQ